ncbi:MAG: response regulator [Armatimonadetes bacterium]|nr:response regulator [Armatimonadota bacterium]
MTYSGISDRNVVVQSLARVSHEIRTPLTAILGLVDMLRETNLTDEQARLLGIIHNNGESLVRLVTDILELAKLESLGVENDERPVDLVKEMSSAAQLFALAAHAKGLTIHVDHELGFPLEFTGNSLRIRQILINLVSNAVKYTDHGDIVIWARCVRSEGSENQAEIHFGVRDTGRGIRKSDIDRIVRPFEQGAVASQAGGTGFGLGLSICRELVEAMGGTLSVTSQYRVGTTVECLLPATVITWPESHLSFPTAIYASVSVSSKGHREILERLLEEIGVQVIAPSAIHHPVSGEGGANLRIPLMLMIDDKLPLDARQSLVHMAKHSGYLPHTIVFSNSPHCPLAKSGRVFCGCLRHESTPREIVRKVAEVLRHPKCTPISVVEPTPAPYNGKTAIVIDDTMVNLIVLRRVVGQLGFNVQTVSSGQEALELFRASAPDLVVVDCMMPGMDGYQTSRAIREKFPHADMTIVMCTANEILHTEDDLARSGIDAIVAKPLKSTDLLKALQGRVNQNAAA